ncbi:MAG: hypothetical protein CMG55_08230 [Candidatus Marinimicrobia bacterium]|nr:hypothetical protein [Candidatus Neomarinimicrobiota bacterium]
MVFKSKYCMLLFVTMPFVSLLDAQSLERGDPNYRRETPIDVNKVRASIHNIGSSGGGGAYGFHYEWPTNSDRRYIAYQALYVGSEVVTNSGETKPLVTIAHRSDQEGNSMMWEPIPGYLNPNSTKIAISDNETTWPNTWPDKLGDNNDPGWAGSWNGYFGKNQFNAGQEIFYKISDDRNYIVGYPYSPDTTDLTRKGAGIQVGVRAMEWKQILIEDVVFLLHEVTNDGSYDYEKVAFGYWLANCVGGNGDCNDDVIDFDLLTDIAWSLDNDGIGGSAFGTDPVGVGATSFIETPGNDKDRIDNDGDGETMGPVITEDMIINEILGNSIDDNFNGLVDENLSHVPVANQSGVGFADYIDNNGNGEAASPIITQEMIDAASSQNWNIWPHPNDGFQEGVIHLIQLDETDLGAGFADGIDNNADPEDPYLLEYPVGLGADVGSPVITAEMVSIASNDAWHRYKVPGTNIILYDLGSEDIGKSYADGIDNDGDGAIDEGIDEGIDEMIDESRDDGIDNDGDWTFIDDVGLNGDESGGIIAGVGDQKPTTGSGTGFPGEPNIDKTDVSESDQMGLTSVQKNDGGFNTASDNSLWTFYLSPGNIWDPPPGGDEPGSVDMQISSGFFPLKAGQTERIAMAIMMGNDQQDAIRNKYVAQLTYESDYQFAKAPNPPIVTALAGDGKVTLYWDNKAELTQDKYMGRITNGVDLYDFEGYKIYRATDFEFNDAYNITDGDGNRTFMEPYVQNGVPARWDLVNGKNGWHPIDLNGVKFYLGDDTGLVHSYVDNNVVNGQRYYYAVVSYDYGGDATNNIIPSDSPMRLRVHPLTGEIEMGPNVVGVVPSPPSAGYVEASLVENNISHVAGSSSGEINLEIIDPSVIKNNHRYRITFEDTLFANQQGLAGYDTATTKSYSLIDITNQDNHDTLLKDIESLPIVDGPVIDGFRLSFYNVGSLGFNQNFSYWSNDSLWTFDVGRYFTFNVVGSMLPYDYRIIFTEEQSDSSIDLCMRYLPNSSTCFPGFLHPAKEVNFRVERQVSLTGEDEVDWEQIPIGFIDVIPFGDPDGYFNADGDRESDWIVFMDHEDEEGNPIPSWRFLLNLLPYDEMLVYDAPQPGDTAYVIIDKPFLSSDVYEFNTIASHINVEDAVTDLDKIKVVPNPYFAASAFENQNTFNTGRGPREIQFRYLPNDCTIRIYTISGELVKTIHHSSPIESGTGRWDLLTKDNLAASFGVYVYHIEADNIGEKIGKLAIVK